MRRATKFVEEAISIHRSVRRQGPLASALILASDHYAELAELAPISHVRRNLATKALNAAVDACAICRSHNFVAQRGRAMGKVAMRSCALARLATLAEEREKLLKAALFNAEQALHALYGTRSESDLADLTLQSVIVQSALISSEPIEQQRPVLMAAIRQAESASSTYRKLGLHQNIALSLHVGSLYYIGISKLEQFSGERTQWLKQALSALEEVLRIQRSLGLWVDIARALVGLSICYTELSDLELENPRRNVCLRMAEEHAGEAVLILRELGLAEDLTQALIVLSKVHRLFSLKEHDNNMVEHLSLSRRFLEEAIALARETGDIPHLMECTSLLSTCRTR